jgi:hypothetical protein
MPWARQSAGSSGGMALAFVTSRKKASILPAGAKPTRSRPTASPTYAQVWGTFRGASKESPGASAICFRFTSTSNGLLDQEESAAAVLRRHFELERGDPEAAPLAEPILAARYPDRLPFRMWHGDSSESK